jgi:hypothetical protein
MSEENLLAGGKAADGQAVIGNVKKEDAGA